VEIYKRWEQQTQRGIDKDEEKKQERRRMNEKRE
jgi:hypothetical protein